MSSVAIYGVNISKVHFDSIYILLNSIQKNGFSVYVYKPFHEHLETSSQTFDFQVFTNIEYYNIDFIFSIGGDGTFLKCSHLFYIYQIPILGVNFGKLGFLADVTPDIINSVIQDIVSHQYEIRERSLLSYSMTIDSHHIQDVALNEISLQKSNILKLIKINTYVDDNYFCSFWADGVIISTPTGSTGYSLSLGGPIVTPNSNVFIMMPIAPHTLSVRPIIIPDSSNIVIEAEGEYTNFLLSNDYKSSLINTKPRIEVRKSEIAVRTLQLKSETFFDTLRKKLNLGLDLRK
ncbi:MAG: NAD(+)/NADH kinase [Bacteroidales bacterium]